MLLLELSCLPDWYLHLYPIEIITQDPAPNPCQCRMRCTVGNCLPPYSPSAVASTWHLSPAELLLVDTGVPHPRHQRCRPESEPGVVSWPGTQGYYWRELSWVLNIPASSFIGMTAILAHVLGPLLLLCEVFLEGTVWLRRENREMLFYFSSQFTAKMLCLPVTKSRLQITSWCIALGIKIWRRNLWCDKTTKHHVGGTGTLKSNAGKFILSQEFFH